MGHLRALAQPPLMFPAPTADHVRVQGFHIGAHTVGHQPQQITQGAPPQAKVEAAADRDGEEGKGFRGLMQLCTAVSMGNLSPQMVSCPPSSQPCCCIDQYELLPPQLLPEQPEGSLLFVLCLAHGSAPCRTRAGRVLLWLLPTPLSPHLLPAAEPRAHCCGGDGQDQPRGAAAGQVGHAWPACASAARGQHRGAGGDVLLPK